MSKIKAASAAAAVFYSIYCISSMASHIYCNMKLTSKNGARPFKTEWRFGDKMRVRRTIVAFVYFFIQPVVLALYTSYNCRAKITVILSYLFLVSFGITCSSMAALKKKKRRKMDHYLCLSVAVNVPYAFLFLSESIMRTPSPLFLEITTCLISLFLLCAYTVMATPTRSSDNSSNFTLAEEFREEIVDDENEDVMIPSSGGYGNRRQDLAKSILKGIPKIHSRNRGEDEGAQSFDDDFLEKYKNYNPRAFDKVEMRNQYLERRDQAEADAVVLSALIK